jgi:hypothetical protein
MLTGAAPFPTLYNHRSDAKSLSMLGRLPAWRILDTHLFPNRFFLFQGGANGKDARGKLIVQGSGGCAASALVFASGEGWWSMRSGDMGGRMLTGKGGGIWWHQTYVGVLLTCGGGMRW